MVGTAVFFLYFLADVLRQLVTNAIVSTVCFLFLLLVAFVFRWNYEGDEVPEPYRLRGCEGLHWKRRFPQAPKDEIRHFLSIFVSSFGFREKDRLKFGPDDRIADVYHAIYRPVSWMDDMELEEFFCRVGDTYGIDPKPLWNSLTLGDLFGAAHAAGLE